MRSLVASLHITCSLSRVHWNLCCGILRIDHPSLMDDIAVHVPGTRCSWHLPMYYDHHITLQFTSKSFIKLYVERECMLCIYIICKDRNTLFSVSQLKEISQKNVIRNRDKRHGCHASTIIVLVFSLTTGNGMLKNKLVYCLLSCRSWWTFFSHILWCLDRFGGLAERWISIVIFILCSTYALASQNMNVHVMQ